MVPNKSNSISKQSAGATSRAANHFKTQSKIEHFFKRIPATEFQHFVKRNANTEISSVHKSGTNLIEIIDLVNSPPPKRTTRINDTIVSKKRRKRIECPSYKIIKGTTFAVDAFRFGYIDDVTHYFLSHFHADHYVGLTKKFEMPIYCSEETARLISTFIGIKQKYLFPIKLNTSIKIENVTVILVDANHCPGAVMFLFTLPNGKSILHTGDFRACPDMESEPVFWNNIIDTVYLDTTYLPTKQVFKSQYESIDDVLEVARKIQDLNLEKRILYVCGSYLIGKEKVWLNLAETFDLYVWAEDNRRRAINAINDEKMLVRLMKNSASANIHVIPMNEITYSKMVDYLDKYSESFDVLLGIRPSCWKLNSKSEFRGRINILDVEYSEHSSYIELRRFVAFIQPITIISTVPIGSNISQTSIIPSKWYDNEIRCRRKEYQLSITQYLKQHFSQ